MTPKRLKDCRWDLPSFKIEDGSVLNQPRIRIENVNYNAPSLTALIEVRFRENSGLANFEHARTFTYQLQEDSQESISAENVQEFITTVFPTAVFLEI
jgi:hypothetical protein